MVFGIDLLASLDNIEGNFGNLCLKKWEVEGKKYYLIHGDYAMCIIGKLHGRH
jgi:hypothetical protein